MTNKKFGWIFLGILFLAVVLRVPGLWWGYSNLDFFEPDEYQYFGIARNIINQFDNKLVPDVEVTDQFNARALGVHMVWLGYPAIKFLGLPNYYLLAAGRLIVLAYSLAILFLLAIISRKIFNDVRIGLLAALGLAIFDLNVTYSHYGVPDIPHVFWFYFSLYWTFRLISSWSKDKNGSPLKEILWVSVGAAFSLSFRFQVVPLLALAVVLCWGLWTAAPAYRRKRLMCALTVGLLVAAGVFYISVGFDYNWHEFLKSKKELVEGALDIIQNGSHAHWLYNPFLYFMAVLAGTSFLAVVSAIASLIYFWRRETKTAASYQFVLLMLSVLSVSFVFLWVGDGTFVRHANIFLPALALLSAYGGIKFYDRFQIRPWLKIATIGGVIIYTLGLTVFSQYYFVRDNRYEAAKFLKNYSPSKKIAYSTYSHIKGLDSPVLLPDLNNVDIVVMHEALYSRYYKSFTVPFKRFPGCCQDTFLCLPQECSVVRSILKNETDYRLIKKYPIKNPFPERLVFKSLFGTYETFLGNVLIYEKQTIPSSLMPATID